VPLDFVKDRKEVNQLSRHSENASVHEAEAWMRAVEFYGKAFGGIIHGIGYYYATQAKNHVRLHEIVVKASLQGCGYGSLLWEDLCSRSRLFGVESITLKCEYEPSKRWFLTHGAECAARKGAVWEMTKHLN
jgi:GNAT superfamily N-acetyltransferase